MAQARKIDIDRLAQQAMQGGALSSEEDDQALMREVAGHVAGWNILVRPLAPKTMSDGGIALPQVSIDSQTYAITCGRVVGVGPTALQGKTTSGIELSKLSANVSTEEQLLGKYILHQRFTGQEIIRRGSGVKLLLIEVTNILMVDIDPDKWAFLKGL